jgi:hypothetical protein
MVKRTLWVILVLAFALTFSVTGVAAQTADYHIRAVYLGIDGYGTGAAAFNNPSAWQFNFAVGGMTAKYRIDTGNNFYINKQMAQGYVFDLTVRDGVVIYASEPEPDIKGTVISIDGTGMNVGGQTVDVNDLQFYAVRNRAGGSTVTEISADDAVGKTVKVYGNRVYQTFVAEPYTAPVKGEPGLRTVKNLIATSLEPAGTTLYIFGGSWTWAGEAVSTHINYNYDNPTAAPNPQRPIVPPWAVRTSHQSATIGLPQKWIDFFQAQDANFTYRIGSSDSRADSYYPPHLNASNRPPNSGSGRGILNEYNFAGADCSGYMGWVLYNTLQYESGREGYVNFARYQARDMAHRGYGTHTRSFTSPNFRQSSFKPGDVFSMAGHVWVTVGVCADGSILMMHSAPSNSRTGRPGGGVQLTGIRASSGPGSLPNSQAHRLAVEYMARYYPEWSRRYVPIERTFASYTNLGTGRNNAFTGRFTWSIGERGLLDPDGYLNMTADEILKDLFGENRPPVRVFVDGNQVEFDQPPIIDNGRTLVPIRAIAEAMNATVYWDEVGQSAVISKDGLDVFMGIGNNTVVNNGVPIVLDVPPQNVGGRILVPVRILADAFGAEVKWCEDENAVYVAHAAVKKISFNGVVAGGRTWQ